MVPRLGAIADAVPSWHLFVKKVPVVHSVTQTTCVCCRGCGSLYTLLRGECPVCGGRWWLRLHPYLVDYTVVSADSIPVFLREQLLSLPHTLRVIVVERLSTWVTVVRSGYSQAADKDNLYATPPLHVGWQAKVFHGAACPYRPLSGLRYNYGPHLEDGQGGPLHLSPLRLPLQATLCATFCKLCGRPSPLDAAVLTQSGVCIPRVFCLHKSIVQAVFTSGVALGRRCWWALWGWSPECRVTP